MEEIWVSSFLHPEKYYSARLWSPGPSPAADLLQRCHSWPWQMPIHCRGYSAGHQSVRIKVGKVPWDPGGGMGKQDHPSSTGSPRLPSTPLQAAPHLLRRTEPGWCHSPRAAKCCGSWWHWEFLLSPLKIWCTPRPLQGTAPSALWVSSHPARLRPSARAQQALGQEGVTRTAPFLASISL